MAKNAIIGQKVAITPPQPAASEQVRSAQAAASAEPIRKVRLGDFIEAYKELDAGRGYPVAAVGKKGIRLRSEIYTKDLCKDTSKNRVIRRGCLVIGMGSKQIDFGILSSEAVYSISPAYHTFRVSGIDLDYLRYALEARNADMSSRFLIASCRQGKAVDLGRLKGYLLNVHEKNTQREIAEELNRICELKRTAEKLVEKYRQLVKAKFSEMFGDVTESGVGWPMRSLESVCAEIVDCPHTTPHYLTVDTGYGCIRTSIIRKDGIQWNQLEYICESEYRIRIARREPRMGDIVYLREGGVLGIAAVINRNQKVALGQRTMLLSPNTKLADSEYLCCAMNSLAFYDRITRQIGCSTAPHLNVADIKAFEIALPPLALQREFAAFVEKVEKLEAAAKATVEKYDLLYRSKLQEYFG